MIKKVKFRTLDYNIEISMALGNKATDLHKTEEKPYLNNKSWISIKSRILGKHGITKYFGKHLKNRIFLCFYYPSFSWPC